jgi:hypothetical protein
LGTVVEPDFQKIVEAIVENKQFSWTKEIDVRSRENLEEFESGLEIKKLGEIKTEESKKSKEKQKAE